MGFYADLFIEAEIEQSIADAEHAEHEHYRSIEADHGAELEAEYVLDMNRWHFRDMSRDWFEKDSK